MHFFHMHLSSLGSVLFPCSPSFLPPPPQKSPWGGGWAGGGSIHWISVLGALIYIWRPKITDGCDISCLLISINIFISHAEAEAPVFWLPDASSQLIGKAPDAGKDWGQKEKRVSEDEMTSWQPQCYGHENEQDSVDGEGQGGLEGYI